MLTERQKEIISVLRSELQSNSSKELKKADSTYASELRHLLTQCLEASSYNWRPSYNWAGPLRVWGLPSNNIFFIEIEDSLEINDKSKAIIYLWFLLGGNCSSFAKARDFFETYANQLGPSSLLTWPLNEIQQLVRFFEMGAFFSPEALTPLLLTAKEKAVTAETIMGRLNALQKLRTDFQYQYSWDNDWLPLLLIPEKQFLRIQKWLQQNAHLMRMMNIVSLKDLGRTTLNADFIRSLTSLNEQQLQYLTPFLELVHTIKCNVGRGEVWVSERCLGKGLQKKISFPILLICIRNFPMKM